MGNETSGHLSNARAKLHFTLEEDISEDCKKNVRDKIPGLNVRSFLSFLNRGANFYDGETSTAPVAGNVGTLAWSNASYGQGATISGVFTSRPGIMALSSMVNSTLTIFLRERYVNGMDANRRAAFLFHEALHGYAQGAGLFDQELKAAFGIPLGDPTSRISDHIQKHCFK